MTAFEAGEEVALVLSEPAQHRGGGEAHLDGSAGKSEHGGAGSEGHSPTVPARAGCKPSIHRRKRARTPPWRPGPLTTVWNYALPRMRFSLVPQTGQMPFAIRRPFSEITTSPSASRFSLHFTQ